MMRRLVTAALMTLACMAQHAAGQGCALTFTTLNFGTYAGTQLNGTATGTVTCSGAWDIPLNAGTGAGATETVRKLTGPGGALLNYSLYTDAARTINWGNTTGNELTGTGNASINVYGQIAAGQSVAPGTYTDTVSSATTSFTLTVVIQATCTIAANPLNFGNYAGALISSSTTISVTCTKSANYNLGLSAGLSTGATVTTRKMTGPSSSLLNYKLFSNSGYTTNWGNTVGTDTVAGTGSGVAQTLTVYGQIPAQQFVRPGSYTDTVVATLTY
jgi:spore coat protein U-like protein